MDVVAVAGERAVSAEGAGHRVDPPLEQRRPRLTGVDVARGVAVLGMYGAHLGPNPVDGGAVGSFFALFEGRSAALFAVLAGVSIALMSGGMKPKHGKAQAQVSLRLGFRMPFLLAFGMLLTWMGTSYLVILAYYGACFILVMPFLRLRAKPLLALALSSAIVFPLLSFWIRADAAPRDLLTIWPDFRPELFGTGNFGDVLLVLLLTGTFPALNLMSYIFAGMAIGRLDLGSTAVCRKLVGFGSLLAVVAYTASWFALHVLGGNDALTESVRPQAEAAGMAPTEFYAMHLPSIHGTPPTTSMAWELVSSPHSYTPFDFLGCIGVAAAVIGGCVLLANRFPRGVRPLADLGSVILSAYVLHFVVIWLIWRDDPSFGVGIFLSFAVVAIIAAMGWRRWVGRGPFEWLLHIVSKGPTKLLLRNH